MKTGYQAQTEYLQELLGLVNMRLSVRSEKPECTREQIRQEENRITGRCEQTFREGGAVGLEYLFRIYGLTEFERHCVQMSLAAELGAEFGGVYVGEQNGVVLPTLGLCLDCFTDSRREQMELLSRWNGHQSVLRYFFGDASAPPASGSGLNAELKLCRRIVDFALDYTAEDPLLQETGGICWPDQSEKMVLRLEQLEQMRRYERENPGHRHLYYLYGAEGSGRQTLMRRMCAESGRALVWADLGRLPEQTGSWEQALRPVFRETAIRHAVLGILGFERLQKDSASIREEDVQKNRICALLKEAARWTDRMFFCSDRPWLPQTPCTGWNRAELELELPDAAGRQKLWEAELLGKRLEKADSARRLADKFALQPGQIRAAAEKAEQLRQWEGAACISDGMLHQACRDQLSSRIGTLAVRVNAAYDWEDLILPEGQKKKLLEACNQVEYRRRIYEEWGFGKKVAYGRGVSMLFSGPPGTGKTMAAQVIARRLGLELYKVDLAGVMSKYVGETEKQLGAVFREVRKSQSILFFDEADAMFGRRSEIKDSHDRYANVQTSYLLQKIEEYDGVVILASNLIQNFDEAFKRRIKFVVEFTLPDRDRREQIWKSVMPAGLPMDEDVDFDFLARSFELSGSSIKNIAVAAAFLAAADGLPVRMTHLLSCVRSEQLKAGKSVNREEFGEYYTQVTEYERRNASGSSVTDP